MTPRLMDRALRLADRGWHVFPLRPGDKRPLPAFTKWEERATTVREQITRWWTGAPYNIGIATGPSGLLVIDCDTTRSLDDSSAWCLAGSQVEIAGHQLPKTFAVRTPSGGVHLYFTAPNESLGNTAGRLARRIDTRGVGGYVVGPGSVLHAGYYRIISRSPVAQLPDWIADALTQESPTVTTVSPDQLGESDVEAILRREVQRVRTATIGSRNSNLNVAAFLLGKLVRAGKITEADAWKILQTAAKIHIGYQGFTQSEMNKTIRSGLSAGIRQAS